MNVQRHSEAPERPGHIRMFVTEEFLSHGYSLTKERFSLRKLALSLIGVTGIASVGETASEIMERCGYIWMFVAQQFPAYG